MSAGVPSQTVLKWLNEYFTEMDNIIRAHGGLLNKFIGDGLLVVYGVPLSRGLEEDTCEAVKTAFAMLRRMEELNLKRDPNAPFPDVHIGVGIHTGPLTCGNVGSANRLEYSVIGETVNLASRLESLNKDFHTEIIMSGDTYEIVKDVFPNLYALGTTPVRGFEKPLMIYSAETQTSRQEAIPLSNHEDSRSRGMRTPVVARIVGEAAFGIAILSLVSSASGQSAGTSNRRPVNVRAAATRTSEAGWFRSVAICGKVQSDRHRRSGQTLRCESDWRGFPRHWSGPALRTRQGTRLFAASDLSMERHSRH